MTDQAHQTGLAGYPGDGTQRWPVVHALDAAVVFRLALESAPAGTSWHAVADEGDKVADIAAVVGRRLGLPVEAVPEETFGPFGPSSRWTSRLPALTHVTLSDGSRDTPASSRTWRTFSLTEIAALNAPAIYQLAREKDAKAEVQLRV